ncbi:hypothetical protein ABH931_004603 [Streptacidiphilus sp. MAP12-33]|uniref:DUF7144 family membrane protein n=1 Tax=Streptacidiphilus sp. MAP12-33 TaxID=3156266 RepID=UPI003511EC02
MTTTPQAQQGETHGPGAIPGPSLFAGTVLLLSGPLSILLGVTGIDRDHVFNPARYVYRFDLTAWGWIHLVVGVALVAAGIGVLAGRSWARWLGVTVAAVSLVTQFMFLPYYPAWAITVMTLDLLVVWALTRFRA